MGLRNLLRGGCRVGPDALPLATWNDLGVLDDVISELTPRVSLF
jgi:hypothetical protein